MFARFYNYVEWKSIPCGVTSNAAAKAYILICRHSFPIHVFDIIMSRAFFPNPTGFLIHFQSMDLIQVPAASHIQHRNLPVYSLPHLFFEPILPHLAYILTASASKDLCSTPAFYTNCFGRYHGFGPLPADSHHKYFRNSKPCLAIIRTFHHYYPSTLKFTHDS